MAKLSKVYWHTRKKKCVHLMSEQTSHINNKRTTEAKWGVEDSRLTFDQS